MSLDEAAKVAAGSSLFSSGTASSKERLHLLLETFKSNPNPSAEQMSELAQKLKLTTGQVQLWWFRKERLDLLTKKWKLALEIELLSLGSETPELRRRVEQDEELRLLRDETAGLPNGKLKLRLHLAKVLEQEKEQVTKSIAGLELQLRCLQREKENMALPATG